MDHLCDMQIEAITNEGPGFMRFKHWGPMFNNKSISVAGFSELVKLLESLVGSSLIVVLLTCKHLYDHDL